MEQNNGNEKVFESEIDEITVENTAEISQNNVPDYQSTQDHVPQPIYYQPQSNNYAPNYYCYAQPIDPYTLKKRQFKSSANKIMLGPMLYFVLSSVLQIIFSICMVFVPREMQRSTTFLLCVSQIVTLISVIVPFVISAVAGKHKVFGLMSFRKFDLKIGIPLILTGCGVCVIANYLSGLFSVFLNVFGIESKMPDLTYDKTPLGILIYMLCISVFPALMEEFAVRGILMGTLRKHCSDAIAITISSLVFGLMHGNLVQLPFAFIMGVYLGFLAVRTNSLWPSIIIHFINNAMSGVIELFRDALSPEMYTLLYFSYAIVFVVLGIIGFALYSKNHQTVIEKEEASYEIKDKTAFGWFFSSALSIIFLIIVAIEIITVQLTV